MFQRPPTVAYFCMEYGLDPRLPLYSGGLGVLAGDFLKAAADAGRDVVGLGIRWSRCYTEQIPDATGWPVDRHPPVPDDHLVPVDVEVTIDVAGAPLPLRAWEVVGLGAAPLYLLEPARPEDAHWTERLYQGGADHRVVQELILGVGGTRLLRALGKEVDVYHFNEGHAVFCGLELVREQVARGLDVHAAERLVRDHVVFTTHTPVPAGNETHPIDRLLRLGAGLGVYDAASLARLGGGDPFQMTVAGLRLAGHANAVAQLHGHTAQRMWAETEGAAPITAITNGVHLGTWQDPRVRDVVARHLDDDALAAVRATLKRELLRKIRSSTGHAPPEGALLVGFARRAATYKRADLVLRDLDRLAPFLAAGRLAFVFAGKAHPDDAGGKEMLQRVVEVSRRFPGAISFLDRYDMALGALLTRGADVWLNNPVRPQEASGTSGMKAAANGVLNLSVLDGWWDEACDHGVNGWQFGDAHEGPDADAHDEAALARVLFDEVLPTWEGDRARWTRMMRASIATATSRFSAARMLADYERLLYAPAALAVAAR